MTNWAAALSGEDSAVLIRWRHMSPYHRLSCFSKNQARSRFIQPALTMAATPEMMASFQCGCRRTTASPWGPCWGNRVFRSPLSGCQDSEPPPSMTLLDELITGRCEVGLRGTECLSWHQNVVVSLLCVCQHKDDLIFSFLKKQISLCSWS